MLTEIKNKKLLIGVLVPHVSMSGGSKRFVRLVREFNKRGYNSVLYSGGSFSDEHRLGKEGIPCRRIERIFEDDMFILINHVTNMQHHMQREFGNKLLRKQWSPEFLIDKVNSRHFLYVMNSKHYAGVKKAHKDERDKIFLEHPKHINVAIASHLRNYAESQNQKCYAAYGGVYYDEIYSEHKHRDNRKYDIGYFPVKDDNICKTNFLNRKLLGIKDVTGDTLRQMYNDCKVFVAIEKFNDAHGWSNTAAEAAACGTPVLSYSGLGCTEDICINGETGFRFSDTNVLKEQAVRLLREDSSLWEEMSINSINNMKQYSFRNFVNDLETIIITECV